MKGIEGGPIQEFLQDITHIKTPNAKLYFPGRVGLWLVGWSLLCAQSVLITYQVYICRLNPVLAQVLAAIIVLTIAHEH